jgi:methanogenic corrinoid protein MtbC1
VRELADEVVLRLVRQLRGTPDLPRDPPPIPIEGFCAALLAGNEDAAHALIREARSTGHSAEQVYLLVLAEAARHLGTMWEENRIGFLEMSLAAVRLFGIMRQMRRDIGDAQPCGRRGRYALFATVPGDDHTLGPTIAADVLRSRGWQVDLLTGVTHDEIVETAAERDPPVIGVSVGTTGLVVPLTRLVVALHVVRPASAIAVSGHAVKEMPGLKALLGLDAMILDPEEAIDRFDGLLPEGGLRRSS